MKMIGTILQIVGAVIAIGPLIILGILHLLPGGFVDSDTGLAMATLYVTSFFIVPCGVILVLVGFLLKVWGTAVVK